MLRLALLLIAAMLVQPRIAVGDSSWKTSSAVWGARDKCTEQARKAFPDYTRESNAKREKARQDCLRANNLSAKESSVPPPMPTPHQ
ncbi:MAG TPA: hypothetical protein VEI03_07115 [Stellaceae bacterium]|nr:hypothetical protein [Stellaceae bacterium]